LSNIPDLPAGLAGLAACKTWGNCAAQQAKFSAAQFVVGTIVRMTILIADRHPPLYSGFPGEYHWRFLISLGDSQVGHQTIPTG
jgi:hypothetical protein